jgi:DNA polymerase-3 subunit epsilon
MKYFWDKAKGLNADIERHRAKEAGFRWNDPVRGAWSRRLSEREVQALPFPVQAVEAA